MPRRDALQISFKVEITPDKYRDVIKLLPEEEDKIKFILSRFNYLNQFENERKRAQREVVFAEENHLQYLDITEEFHKFCYYSTDRKHSYYIDAQETGEILKVDNTDGRRVCAKYFIGLSIYQPRLSYFCLNTEQTEKFNEGVKEILKIIISNDNCLIIRKFEYGFRSTEEYLETENYLKKRETTFPYISNSHDDNIMKIITKGISNDVRNKTDFTNLKNRFKQLTTFENLQKPILKYQKPNLFYSLTKIFFENSILHYGFEYYLQLNNLEIIKFDALKKLEVGSYKFDEEKNSYSWDSVRVNRKINSIIGKAMEEILNSNSEIWERNLMLRVSQSLLLNNQANIIHNNNNNNQNNIIIINNVLNVVNYNNNIINNNNINNISNNNETNFEDLLKNYYEDPIFENLKDPSEDNNNNTNFSFYQ